MPPKDKQMRLEDVLTYTPETYFSESEISIIRGSFSGTEGQRLLKVIRKALIPTISDPDLPAEEFGKDLFMSLVDFKSVPAEEAKPLAMGIQVAMKLILGAIIHLKNIANYNEESDSNRVQRRAKDSVK